MVAAAVAAVLLLVLVLSCVTLARRAEVVATNAGPCSGSRRRMSFRRHGRADKGVEEWSAALEAAAHLPVWYHPPHQPKWAPS